MSDASAQEQSDLVAAREGDEAAFGRLVGPYRSALHAHCYRMLGSVHDAEDALQDALLGAWRGIGGFEGRSSLRSWLYRIATHAAIRVGQGRSRRMLSVDRGPASLTVHDMGEPVTEAVFVEPYPDAALRDESDDTSPEARYDRLESVELAFVAALQELPATQRAVLLLRDVLALPAAEVAETLDTSVASVNSALQRARQNVEERVGSGSQQSALRTLGDAGQKELLDAFIRAWEQQDIEALVKLLAEDVRLAMPPLPAWYDGREAVGRFFAERVFERAWKVVPITANGQLALAGYMSDPARTVFPLSIVDVVSVRDGKIVSLDAFNDPETLVPFGLPAEPHD